MYSRSDVFRSCNFQVLKFQSTINNISIIRSYIGLLYAVAHKRCVVWTTAYHVYVSIM